jgi:hypothetical protein
MTTNPNKYRMPIILWSLVWAFGLIAAAFLFKGNPAKYWIDAALFVGATTYLMWIYERRTRRC